MAISTAPSLDPVREVVTRRGTHYCLERVEASESFFLRDPSPPFPGGNGLVSIDSSLGPPVCSRGRGWVNPGRARIRLPAPRLRSFNISFLYEGTTGQPTPHFAFLQRDRPLPLLIALGPSRIRNGGTRWSATTGNCWADGSRLCLQYTRGVIPLSFPS